LAEISSKTEVGTKWYLRERTRHYRMRCKHMPEIQPKPRRIRNTETVNRIPEKALVPSGCLFEADRIKRSKTLQDMAFSVSGLKIFCRPREARIIR